jgi:lysozyme
MDRVFGADLSHWDGTVEWTLWDHTFKFVFIKISEASPNTGWSVIYDHLAGQHWLGAGQEGLYRGPYHFWRYRGGTPAAQAKHFYDSWVKACAEFGCPAKLELPPVCDFEDMTAPKLNADVKYQFRAFLDEVERLFRVKPIVYTAYWYTSAWVGDCSWLLPYLLWVAHYTFLPNGQPLLMPKGLPKWTFWQYSDRAEIAGVAENDEDVDAFNGSIEQLEALLVTKPGLTLEEKVERLWIAHPELHI